MNPDEFLGALRQMVRPTCPALPPEMDLEDLLKARLTPRIGWSAGEGLDVGG